MAKGWLTSIAMPKSALQPTAVTLDALSTVADPAQAHYHLQKLANPISHNGRSYRGFNPAARKDIDLFAAVLRGEHAIMGFRRTAARLIGELR